MDEHGDGAAMASELDPDARAERSFVGFVKGSNVHLVGSAAGLVAAKGSVSILNGGCGPVLANGGLTIRNGGCGPVIANGDASIEFGGTQAILAAGRVRIGPKALVGFVAAPAVTVADGGKVMFGSRQALMFGAAAGIAYLLLSRFIRERVRS
jgi:hypothetical protein